MAEDPPSPDLLKQIVERLDLLERVLAMTTARLHQIEQHLGVVRQQQSLPEPLPGDSRETHPSPTQVTPELQPSQPTQSTPAAPPPRLPNEETPQAPPPPPTETDATPSWLNESSASRRYQPPSITAAPSGPSIHVENTAAEDEASPAGEVSEKKRRDLESLVGGSWFNWIGIVAVTFGVAFFLKFAFDKQWVGAGTRVSLSAFLGIALLYVGERLRGRGLQSYSYVLSGGGILVLYLSNFAAYSLYHLIGHTPAFVLMAAVTTTAVLLSVRLNALPVAILGLVGGFLTPVLLSTGVDNEVGLFAYVALLDAGVLALAYFKRWRSLDFLSFAGTVAITLGWAATFFSHEKVWTTLVFLSIFFLLYSLLAIFHNVLAGRLTRWFDVSLAVANATFYFGLSYLLLIESGFDRATPATQALLLSIFFAELFYTTWRWSPDDRLLRYTYVGTAVTFLTAAVAIQLELHWVTIVWGVEALMLTWVGLRTNERAARHAALAVFCAAVIHWFTWDLREFAYGVDASFIPLLNRRALSCAVLVGTLAAAAWLYRRAGELDKTEHATVRTFFALTGNAVALTLLSLDLNDYFTARLSRSGVSQTDVYARIENARQFSISVLWTLYAATTLALGVLRRLALLRWAGLLLLFAAISKVIVFDSAFYAASWHLPILNQTFMAYALLVAVLAFGAWLYGREEGAVAPEQRVMLPLLIVAANVFALAALSLEVFGYYDRLSTGTEIPGELQEGKMFTLALVWTLYATSAFLFGAWRRARVWRWGGLILLALTTPLVLSTLIYYDASWHTLILNRTVGAFAIFVVALWLVVWTYDRSGEAFGEAPAVRAVATVLANLLAITALSTQAAGYFDAKISRAWSGADVAARTNEVGGRMRDLELAKQLSLSVVWALYASGLLLAGRARHLTLLRVMGLALLSLTTLKVFLWDLSSLDRIYRIISFIMLGAILLVVSYFYQRVRGADEVQNPER